MREREREREREGFYPAVVTRPGCKKGLRDSNNSLRNRQVAVLSAFCNALLLVTAVLTRHPATYLGFLDLDSTK